MMTAKLAPDADLTDAEPRPTDADQLPLDVIFDVLANERRRMVLHRLQVGDGSTTLSDLAEYIAAVENDKPERALTSSERKRVYICLYQSHLPKLDDAGVIDFDGDRKTVEVGPNLEEVTRFLPSTEDEDAPSGGLSTSVAEFAQAAGRLINAP